MLPRPIVEIESLDPTGTMPPHQPDLFPPQTSDLPRTARAGQDDSPAPLWLQRVSLIILVVFCLYVGLLLLLLPWTRFWQENHYLLTVPALGPILNSGSMRGVISGLGLLDMWIGISEVMHTRRHRA